MIAVTGPLADRAACRAHTGGRRRGCGCAGLVATAFGAGRRSVTLVAGAAKPAEDTRRGGRRSKNTRTAARAIGPRQTAVRHALPTAEQDRFVPGWTTRPDQSQRCALPSLRVPGDDSGITQNSSPAGSRITCQE